MAAEDLNVLTKGYLQAFDARDLEYCLTFYHDDSTLIFQNGRYTGRDAIKSWHEERFKADLRVLKQGQVEVTEDRVAVDLTVSSKRLKAWRIRSVDGKAIFQFEAGKIREANFGLKKINV